MQKLTKCIYRKVLIDLGEGDFSFFRCLNLDKIKKFKHEKDALETATLNRKINNFRNY